MPGCKLVHREGRSDPKNVNRTVDMRAVAERHGDTCQAVVLWRIAVSSAHETRVADSVPAPTRLAEDPRKPFRVASESVARLVGPPQPLQNPLSLLLRTPCEIVASGARHQPADPSPNDRPLDRPDDERAERPACLPSFHVVAGGYEQIGGPLDLLAQTKEHGGGRLRDAIVPIALSHYASQGVQPVAAIGEAPGDQAFTFQRIENSQEARL